MYRNDGVVVFDRKKLVFEFGFEKSGIFNKILFKHKAFYGYFW